MQSEFYREGRSHKQYQHQKQMKTETDKEKRKIRERARLLRVARKMERLKNLSDEVGAGVPTGDPFALELQAKLNHITGQADRWGKQNKRASAAKRRRFRNGFTPPRSWKAGEQQGLATLDKALLFMSTFRDMDLGFRDLHVLIMIVGDNGISIQEAADMSGITYWAIRKSVSKMAKAGFVKEGGIKRSGGQKPLLTVELTAKGAGVMRALNRFDPSKVGDYDRLVAMAKPNIPTDLRILQMKGVIDEARGIQQDI